MDSNLNNHKRNKFPIIEIQILLREYIRIKPFNTCIFTDISLYFIKKNFFIEKYSSRKLVLYNSSYIKLLS